MPMYWADFFVDTAKFDAERTGVYAGLLGHAWINGGWLDDDDDELARLARCTPQQWKKHRAKLGRAPYFEVAGGRWTQKRLTAELEKAMAMYQSSVVNGRLGGRPRKTREEPPGFDPDTPPVNPPDGRAGNPAKTQPQPQAPIPPKGGVEGSAGATAPAPKAVRLARDWVCPQEWLEWAIKRRRWPLDYALEVALAFRNHWTSKSKDAARLDWERTWQNWVLRERDPPVRRDQSRRDEEHQNIKVLTGGYTRERTIEDDAYTLGREAFRTLPSDLRESGDDDVGEREARGSAIDVG